MGFSTHKIGIQQSITFRIDFFKLGLLLGKVEGIALLLSLSYSLEMTSYMTVPQCYNCRTVFKLTPFTAFFLTYFTF
jgi:hypothetical protein